jgi:type II restriction enzyme
MNLLCDFSLAAQYRSRAQIARVLSEAWCLENVYCPSCPSPRIARLPHNTRGIDFRCTRCEQTFQLKSTQTWDKPKIVDAGYEAMMEAIRSDRAPNLLLLNYNSDWYVQNLLVVPRYFFSESTIEKRKPLSSTARRAGWIGCNILLNAIPADGRIPLVTAGRPHSPKAVRDEFHRAATLGKVPVESRGWTVDVLNVVRQLGPRFSLTDVYARDVRLSALHPRNLHIRPKIRQQLQVLRDLGFVRFLGNGIYESA